MNMVNLDIVSVTLRDIVEALQAGEITSEELVEMYLGEQRFCPLEP